MDKLTWRPRKAPLAPVGILALPEHRAAMKRSLLQLSPERLSRLRGSVSDNVLIILGNEEDLPWLPNGVYLGQDSTAPHLYFPTQLLPSVPVSWLDRAFLKKFGQGQFVINPWQHEVYNLSQALKIASERLQEIT